MWDSLLGMLVVATTYGTSGKGVPCSGVATWEIREDGRVTSYLVQLDTDPAGTLVEVAASDVRAMRI